MLALRRSTAALVPALTLALSGVAVVIAPAAQAAAPANDNLAGAITLTPGTTVSTTTAEATIEGAEAMPSCGTLTNSVWFKWTSPAGAIGRAAIQTSGGVAGFDSAVGVWTSPTGTYPLTANSCFDDGYGGGLFLTKGMFTIAPSTTYYFQLGMYAGPGAGTAPPGPVDITLTVPENDMLANAVIVAGGTTTSSDAINNTLATKQAGEVGQPAAAPFPNCANVKNTVWYRVAPVSTGQLTVTTRTEGGPVIDTLANVWSGPAAGATPASLTAVGCNDDIAGSSNLFSSVTVNVSAGTTYYIQIASYDGPGGTAGRFNADFTLTGGGGPVPPANDDIADAFVIAVPEVATTDTTNASLEAGEGPVVGGDCDDFASEIAKTVWYQYQPETSGPVTFDTGASPLDRDTIVAIYAGPALSPSIGSLSPLTCNDQGGPGDLSTVTFVASVGFTYYVQLGTYDGTDSSGPMTLTSSAPAPTETSTALDAVVTGRQVDLTATVTPFDELNPLAGSVEFFDGAASIGSVPLSATGTATTSVLTAAPGHHDYTAVFTSSDSAEAGSTSAVEGVDIVVDTTTALTGEASGRTVTLSSTVSGPAGTTPVGSVQFLRGATLIDTVALTGGTATKVLTDVPLGTRTYHAVYVPTAASGYNASTSPDVDVTVSEQTALTLDGSATGTTVTLEAAQAVAAGSDAPSGTIEFFEGATSKGSVDTTNSGATLVLSNVTPGSHTYRAAFTPTTGSGYQTATSADRIVTVTVSTTTTLSTSVAGRLVTLTSSVTGPAGTTPAGTVAFYQDTALLSEVSLADAADGFAVPGDQPLGIHTFRAVFVPAPGSGFNTSTSPDADATVTEQTALTLTGSASGQQVTLTATQGVAAGSQLPEGTIQFFEGAAVLGEPIATTSGASTKVLSGVTTGSHTYHAVFTPGEFSGYLPSTSADRTVTVSSPPPPAKVASSTKIKAPKEVKSGKAPKITITVKRGAVPASGKVTIKIGKRVFKTVALAANGTVKVKLPKLTKTAKIIVSYLGDATTLASSDKAVIKITKTK